MSQLINARGVSAKFQRFDPSQYELVKGLWLSGTSYVHVFNNKSETIGEKVNARSICVFHDPAVSVRMASDIISRIEVDHGIQVNYQEDPISVMFARSVEHLANVVLNAIPSTGTRLIVLCTFDWREAQKQHSLQLTNMVEHAVEREISIMKKKQDRK